MNITNLIVRLQSALNSTTETCSQHLGMKAIQRLYTGAVKTVPNITTADLSIYMVGDLVFDQATETLFWYQSQGTPWIPLTTSNTFSTAFAWGCNISGPLGDNTSVNKSSPVSVVGNFVDWRQISAGGTTVASIRTNGTLWTWGANTNGKLGNGTTTNKSSPVSVVGGFTDWCQVSTGANHIAAIRTNCTLWAWGFNGNGRLGDNTAVDKSSPVSVAGGFTDWCQVSAGAIFTAAVRTNGTLWTWGYNTQGQLGDNTTVSKSSPVSVVGGFTDWCQVSVSSHAAAIRTNGTLWAWGNNACGRLGDGTAANKSSPVSVVGGFTDWCQVSSSGCHTAAVRTNGTLWMWGFNTDGRLGDGTTTNKSSPVSVVGGATNWCWVSAGTNHTAALQTNGVAWTWGDNTSGQLGDSTLVNKSSPVSIMAGGFADSWIRVAAANCFTAAIRCTNI